MIINFSVQNFYSIKDKVTLSFEATKSDDLEDYYLIEPKKGLRLLKLGLIYGANASGKTTILKALDFLRSLVLEPVRNKFSLLDFYPFLFNKNKTESNTTFFELEFFTNGIRYFYTIEFVRGAIISEELYGYKPNKSLVFKRNTDLDKQLTSIIFGKKLKVNKFHKAVLEANTLWNNTVLGGFSKTNIEILDLKNCSSWFKNNLNSIVFPTTDLTKLTSDLIEDSVLNKKYIISILRKADFKIEDIVIENDKTFKPFQGLVKNENLKNIYFDHKINDEIYSLHYKYQSQGTQRYYQFAGLLALMIQQSTIFPIDELEASLHPDLFEHFLLLFLRNTNQSQLIATTHHRELLMEKDIFRSDAIWFTEKKEDESTDLFSLADFDSSVVRKDTGSIYNAYKIGKLGATPNLQDYYIDTETTTNGEN